MERKKLDMIRAEISGLPQRKKNHAARWQQYEDAKRRLSPLAATRAEYEWLCLEIANVYRL